MSETAFTHEGLVHNLDLLTEILSGVETCYANNLEGLGATLVRVSIYVLKKTQERAMTTEAMSE